MLAWWMRNLRYVLASENLVVSARQELETLIQKLIRYVG